MKLSVSAANISEIFVPVGSTNPALITSGESFYLVSGGPGVTTSKLSWTEKVEKIGFTETVGTVKSLKRRIDGLTITASENGENVLLLKYSGVNGVELFKRIFAKNSPIISYATDYSGSIMMTSEGRGSMGIYASVNNFDSKPLNLKCR